LSESRVEGETRFRRDSLESYRARAAQVWASGADGIYIFNYFDPKGPIWRELGDPKALRSRDKLYFISPRNGSPDAYLAGGRQYQHVPILTPSNPWLVPEDRPSEVDLAVGDDLPWAQQAGLKPKVTCHVQTLGTGRPAVMLNGRPLEDPTVAEQWLDFPVPPNWVRKGVNRFTIAGAKVPQSRASSAEWNFAYGGTQLPESPWRKEGFYTAGCLAEVRDGKLLIADRSTEGGGYAFFRCPCFIRPGDETVIEARLKTISGWSSVIVENGVSGEEICFYPDMVRARHCGLNHAVNTADAFHTYRIVLKEKDFQVYVDGQLRINGEGRLTHPASNGRSGVMFGAANSPSLGEALWESVRIRNRAVTLLDLVLEIRYGEG
jgi:hypothetical protein